ncbi:hypothetical protein ACT3G6_14180 [Actibacterium sp. D379-3]
MRIFAHADLEEFQQAFRDMEYGIPRRDFAAYIGQHKVDPNRVPAGKSMMHIYAFAPYNLKGAKANGMKSVARSRRGSSTTCPR